MLVRHAPEIPRGTAVVERRETVMPLGLVRIVSRDVV
jgi:hypothetical protein